MENLNYSVLSTTAKSVARDILRLRMVFTLQSELRNLNKRLNTETTRKNNTLRRIEVLEYELNQAKETAHPDLEAIEERVNANISNNRLSIEHSDKAINELHKLIDGVNADIDKVQNGETKVNYSEMVNIAGQLGRDFIAAQFNKTEVPTVEAPTQTDNTTE